MNFYPVLTLRYPFEIAEVGGEYIAVGIEDGADSFHGVIKLQNEPAVFMMRELQKGITLPELIQKCMEKFEGSTVEETGPKVIAFLDQFRERGLISADMNRGIRDYSDEEPNDNK